MKHAWMALASVFFVGGAWAQPAGSWLIQGGLTRIAPDVSSGALSAPAPANAQVGVGSDVQPTARLTYVYNDHLAVALPLGPGFKHKIFGAGSISGTGQIGSVSVTPLSVFGEYRFGAPTAKLRPYAMLGLSYAYFHDAQGSALLNGLNPRNPVGGSTGLKVDSRWALTPGLGMVVQLDERWFVDLSWSKSFLKTTATLSTGQSVGATLNPSITTVGLGWRF